MDSLPLRKCLRFWTLLRKSLPFAPKTNWLSSQICEKLKHRWGVARIRTRAISESSGRDLEFVRVRLDPGVERLDDDLVGHNADRAALLA